MKRGVFEITLFEINLRLTRITEEIKELTKEIATHCTEVKVSNEFNLENLREQLRKFIYAIQSSRAKQTDETLKTQMLEFKSKALELKCIENPHVLADELTKLRREWKRYLNKTKTARINGVRNGAVNEETKK